MVRRHCSLQVGVYRAHAAHLAVNNTDNSLPSGLSVLPNVIERSNRTVIAHGTGDYVLIANGTRAMIQNMTWNGQQGFTSPPTTDLVLPGMGSMGVFHDERGLLYAEVALSGHMIPRECRALRQRLLLD